VLGLELEFALGYEGKGAGEGADEGAGRLRLRVRVRVRLSDVHPDRPTCETRCHIQNRLEKSLVTVSVIVKLVLKLRTSCQGCVCWVRVRVRGSRL